MCSYSHSQEVPEQGLEPRQLDYRGCAPLASSAPCLYCGFCLGSVRFLSFQRSEDGTGTSHPKIHTLAFQICTGLPASTGAPRKEQWCLLTCLHKKEIQRFRLTGQASQQFLLLFILSGHMFSLGLGHTQDSTLLRASFKKRLMEMWTLMESYTVVPNC